MLLQQMPLVTKPSGEIISERERGGWEWGEEETRDFRVGVGGVCAEKDEHFCIRYESAFAC